MSSKLLLYHTGYLEIRKPDIYFGRKNADFGQGFYTTGDREFAGRWAREKKDSDIIVNTYELDLTGLCIHRFERDEAWFRYIFDNRALKGDRLPEADVVIGPIANDTIYDTFGIITSGFLKRETALQLLLIGPAYEQIVLKSEKAAEQLTWLSSQVLDKKEISRFRAVTAQEQADYQKLFAETMERLP